MLERIGKFEVKEKIGEGGMGVVYKAYDPLMHRHVAIKTFTAELEVEPEVRSRFLREAIAVGRLIHPNIVTVHDVFEEGDGTYMVMEYLEGQSLGWAMRSGTLKSLEDKLWVMEEVCKGLTFAHSMGVVHRDIKPANIFLTSRGEVKILDFGIARIASTTVSKSTTKIMGTPYYMSPEQWSGGKVDHRADIFALGVMLYEMLTGRRPFESHNPQAVAFQVINSEPTPIQELNTTVPDEVVEIVSKSLAKKPDERFADVQAIQDELQEITDALSDHDFDFEETKSVKSIDAAPQIRPASRSGRTPRSHGNSLSRSRSGRAQADPGKRWLWAALVVTSAIAATAG
ncbi:MAG: hypothetical protein BMS9Abin37_0258 [Acidobacteriota bacterium]|nr:MAG: hypothetical protein BMS9Abin37_0258 [Acidobacteriota bacterium]